MSYTIDEDVAEAIRELLRKEHEDYAKAYESGRRDYPVEQRIQAIGRAVERAYTTDNIGGGKYKSVESVIPKPIQAQRKATVLPKAKPRSVMSRLFGKLFGS